MIFSYNIREELESMAFVFCDLDGTLTKVDTFIPYCLVALLHRPLRLLYLKSIIKGCLGFSKRKLDRQDLKEVFLIAFLKGATIEDVKRWNKFFFRFIFPLIRRKKMLKRQRQHQLAGDSVYIVSASPDIYVKRICKQWQLDGVICTDLKWEDDRLTGRIMGKNCRGEEKARRIRALFTENELEGSYGYGNSEGDLQVLDLVDFSFKV